MSGNKFIEIIKKSAFFITLFLSSFVFLILKNDADPDLWHRMAVGKIFSQLGSVIYNDIFSYLPKNEMWVDHEWLSRVVFYSITSWWGDYGILTLQVLIMFTILILIYHINQLISPENKLRISYYLAALVGIHIGLSSTLRCQSFTYLFFTLWIYLLERVRRGNSRLIWIFPLTMLFWANMHGGFLAGIGLIGFYLIGDFFNKRNIKNYFLIIGSIIPVTLINPYGYKYWVYLMEAATMKRPFITEWNAFNPLESFYAGLGFKILFLILLAGYGYKLFTKSLKIDKVELIALTVTFALAIKHERHSIFFAIIAASYGYQHFVAFLDFAFAKMQKKFSEIFDEDRQKQILFAKDYGVYMFLIVCSVYILQGTPISVNMDKYPVKEIEFIRKNQIAGNLLVPFNWGSYAMWKLYPQNFVSIDGRFEETYKVQSYLDVHRFTIFDDKWEDVFNKYHHDIFLIASGTETYEKMNTLSAWEVAYEGEVAAVFLPVSSRKIDWKLPENEPNYYIKTKYENNIDF